MSRFFCSTRGRLATLREALLERVRVVRTAEEVLHRVGCRDVAAGSEHLIAIAMCGLRIHQTVAEPGANVRGDGVAPKVGRVRSGIRLARHVLPVRRPVRTFEELKAHLALLDLARDDAAVALDARGVVQPQRLTALRGHLLDHDTPPEVARRLQTPNELLWDDLACLDVPGELAKDIELEDVVLEEARWCLHEVVLGGSSEACT